MLLSPGRQWVTCWGRGRALVCNDSRAGWTQIRVASCASSTSGRQACPLSRGSWVGNACAVLGGPLLRRCSCVAGVSLDGEPQALSWGGEEAIIPTWALGLLAGVRSWPRSSGRTGSRSAEPSTSVSSCPSLAQWRRCWPKSMPPSQTSSPPWSPGDCCLVTVPRTGQRPWGWHVGGRRCHPDQGLCLAPPPATPPVALAAWGGPGSVSGVDTVGGASAWPPLLAGNRGHVFSFTC